MTTIRALLATLFALVSWPALADFAFTAGSGQTMFTFTCFTTKHCSAHVPIKSDGTELFTTSAPASVMIRDAAGNVRGANVNASNQLTVSVDGGSVFNSNGPAAKASSSPVTIATDQAVSSANASVAISMNTATTTELVAVSGSTKVYVTAWDVIAAGTGNFKLVYGTGTNCGTGTTDLTGNYNLTAQTGISKGSGIAPVIVAPAGKAVCGTTSAAVQMSGSLTYQQF